MCSGIDDDGPEAVQQDNLILAGTRNVQSTMKEGQHNEPR